MLMGNDGLSGLTGGAGVLIPCRCFILGENSLITSGHTRSFKRKLNSACWRERERKKVRQTEREAGQRFEVIRVRYLMLFECDNVD